VSKRSLAPAAWMLKADTACLSAHALLARGDVDGAANRAYYAMFAAARAALLASGVPVGPEVARTHSGLIGAFGQHLVKNGLVSKDMGRLLNRAHEIRQAADYRGDSVEHAEAQQVVHQAAAFIAAMRTGCMPQAAGDNDPETKPR
jgi:uncharacterized protein (UPF0332 family)